MAIGFGDLVPYSQLPGAVAGEGSERIADKYDQGMLEASKAQEALNAAKMSDINMAITQAKAPSALAFSNLKDAQSINVAPVRTKLEDINAAEKEIMGDSKEQPTELEQKKILARADELARAKQPHFDINNPGEWYAAQGPTSNKELDYEKAKAQLEGRIDMTKMRINDADYRQDRGLNWKDKALGITEAGKDRRVGANPGGGGVPLKVLTTGSKSVTDFGKTTAGQMVIQDSPFLKDHPEALDQAEVAYNRLIRMGAYGEAKDFISTYGKTLAKHGRDLPPPPSGPKSTGPQSSGRAPDSPEEGADNFDGSRGLSQKPAIKKVVSIGNKAYGIGDKIKMGGAEYEVTEGDGVRGGLKRVQ